MAIFFTVEDAVKGTKYYPHGTNTQDRINILHEKIDEGKIPLIKMLREWFDIGLRQAKDLSEQVVVWNRCEHTFATRGVACINEDAVLFLASGSYKRSTTALRKGINTSIRNWHNLGFTCVEDAIIDFLNRNKT